MTLKAIQNGPFCRHSSKVVVYSFTSEYCCQLAAVLGVADIGNLKLCSFDRVDPVEAKLSKTILLATIRPHFGL